MGKERENLLGVEKLTVNYGMVEALKAISFHVNEGEIVAMDSPRELKLQYGERSVEVEYVEKGTVKSRIFFLDKEGDKKNFHEYIDSYNVQTIHTREASLEQIFIKLTGRGLE